MNEDMPIQWVPLRLESVTDVVTQTDEVCSKLKLLLSSFQSDKAQGLDTTLARDEIENLVAHIEDRMDNLTLFCFEHDMDERCVIFEKQRFKLRRVAREANTLLTSPISPVCQESKPSRPPKKIYDWEHSKQEDQDNNIHTPTLPTVETVTSPSHSATSPLPSNLPFPQSPQREETIQFKLRLSPADYALLMKRREELRRHS
ncbi:hypothetical protein P9112_014052 [Eukaryota sp. TZLM1-RC]